MILTILAIFLFTISSTRTINILAGFFLLLMCFGFILTKINLSIGVIFILIYISAVAIILISTLLALGATIRGSDLHVVLLALIPFSFFLFIDQPQLLIAFPTSVSSSGMLSLATDLLVSNAWLTIYLAVYFYAVGLFITGNFYKSLYGKSSSVIRGQALDYNHSGAILL